MALKRYLPKYKKLVRFQQPVWFEKRVKIRRFKKQKWERLKRLYYPRKVKFFRQDVSAYPLTLNYEVDRVIRLKKTYKYLLRDKQRFQLYYGNGRFRFYQLKNMVKKIWPKARQQDLSPAKVLLGALENRLEMVLYRFSLVSSIAQSRRLIRDGRILIDSRVIRNPNYLLKAGDRISFDPWIRHTLCGFYLRDHVPYFFYRYKADRRSLVRSRKQVWQKNFLERYLSGSFLSLRQFLLGLKKRKKNATT